MNNFNLNINLEKTGDVELGEEALHKIYNFKNVDKQVNLLMGVDGGSTQTRVVLISKTEKNVGKQFIIPSKSALAPDDKEVRPTSENLYDNMDTIITDLSNRTEGKIKKERVLRGRMVIDAGLKGNTLSTAEQKIHSKKFYINIIDAIGYAICLNYEEEIPNRVTVGLGVALPPDDMATSSNRKDFENNILGKYKWSYMDKVSIDIDIVAVTLDTEPDAYVRGMYTIQATQPNFAGIPECVMCVNAGGRSTGFDIVKDGKRIASASTTGEYGGTLYLSEIGKNVSEVKRGKPPKAEQIRKALETGMLKKNSELIDIKEQIDKASKFMANEIRATLISVCDTSGTALDEIDTVIFSGRLATPCKYRKKITDEEGNEDFDYMSISDYLEESIYDVAPSIDYISNCTNYIPLGLTMAVFKQHGDLLEDDEYEDDDEYEEDEMEDVVEEKEVDEDDVTVEISEDEIVAE